MNDMTHMINRTTLKHNTHFKFLNNKLIKKVFGIPTNENGGISQYATIEGLRLRRTEQTLTGEK